MSSAKLTKANSFAPPKTEINVHQELDPYRTLPASLKKPLLEFSAANPFPESQPTTSSLLNIKSQHYNARLASKSLILVDPPLNGPAADEQARKQSAVEKGKKRRALATKEELERWDRDEVRGAKRKRAGLKSRKETRKAWNIEAGVKVQYNLLLPLHYLYLSYLSELLSLPPYQPDMIAQHSSAIGSSSALPPLSTSKLPNGLGCELISARLAKSDMTGALLRVKRSKHKGLEGIEGLVIQETAGTFKIVGKNNVIRVIPKSNTLFLLSFPAYAFHTLPHAPNGHMNEPPVPEPLPPIDPSDPLAFLRETESEAETAEASTSTLHERFQSALQTIPRIEIDILGSAFAFRSEERLGRKFKPGTVLDQGWAVDWLLPEVFSEAGAD